MFENQPSPDAPPSGFQPPLSPFVAAPQPDALLEPSPASPATPRGVAPQPDAGAHPAAPPPLPPFVAAPPPPQPPADGSPLSQPPPGPSAPIRPQPGQPHQSQTHQGQPQPLQQPAAVPVGTPGAAGRFVGEVIASLKTKQLWIRALQTAGITYAASFAAALLIIVLSGSLVKSVGESSGVRVLDVGTIIGAAFQLVGAGFGGSFAGQFRDPSAAGAVGAGSFGLRTMPLLIPVLAALAAWLFMRLRPLAAGITVAQKCAIGVATGAVFATGTTLLAALTPFKVPVVGVAISTAGFAGWVFAFLAVAAFVAWRDGGPLRLPRPWAAALAGAVVHYGVLIAIAFVAVTIGLAVNAGDAVAAVPYFGLSLAIWATVLALFGSVGADIGGLGGAGSDLGSVLGPLGLPRGAAAGLSAEPLSVLSPLLPTWAPALVLVALLVAVLAGLVIYLRGGADGPIALARTAGSWLVLGLLLSFVSSLALSVKVTALSIASFDVSGSFGPTPTTFLVLLLWGALAGAVAIWLAPHLAGALPAGLVALLQRGVPPLAPAAGAATAAATGAATAALGQPAPPAWHPVPPPGTPAPGTPASLPTPGAPAPGWQAGTPASGTPAQQPPGAWPAGPQPAAGAAAGFASTVPAPPSPFAAHPHAAPAPTAVQPAVDANGLPVVGRQPMTPAAKRGLIIGGAAVGLLIVAAVVLPMIRTSVFGPEATARAYMSALESGQAGKAVELAPVGNIGDASRALLTDAAYQAATDRPTNFGLGKVSINGDIATMDVTYNQAGAQHQAKLTATRSGTAWLIADQWRLTSALPVQVGMVTVPGGPSQPRAVTVGGVAVGDLTSERMKLAALPGTYAVTVQGTDLLKPAQGALTVGEDGPDSGDVIVVEEATEAFAAKATEAVTARINACAARTDYYLPDAECPFSYAYGPSTSNQPAVTYKVEEQPALTLKAVERSGGGKSWSVVSTRQGRYSYTYTSDYFGSQSVNQDTRTFTVQADITVAANGDISITTFR